jgi:phage baseplate assembly protein W
MPSQITLPFQLDAFGRIGHTDNLAKQLADNIVSIVGTQPSQRRMRPDYGVNLMGYLFKPINDADFDRLVAEIEAAVTLYEPRVTVTSVDNLSDADMGLLGVRVNFNFATANSAATQSYQATVLPTGSVVSP